MLTPKQKYPDGSVNTKNLEMIHILRSRIRDMRARTDDLCKKYHEISEAWEIVASLQEAISAIEEPLCVEGAAVERAISHLRNQTL
jgi:hypothetical protein